MIPFEEALSRVLAESLRIETETIDLRDAMGRFLCEHVCSPVDAPPFDKAAMDGYAVGDEIRTTYVLRQTISAGNAPSQTPLKPGEAAKIMTGAPIPAGATRVIRVEFTNLDGETVEVTEPEPYPNTILQGENLRKGDPLLAPGRLGPKEIGTLAAAGVGTINVYRQLRIGVIRTGDELVVPGTPLAPGQIHDSNGPQLHAQILNAGGIPVDYGIVPDDPEKHRSAVERALVECNIVLLTGGVSMGDFDYVPGVLTAAGVNTIFHRVRIKPGRPTLFGRNENTIVFGLPGNPVSTFVIFEVMVRPLLHQLQEAPPPGLEITAALASPIRRRDTERAEFYPAVLGSNDGGTVVTPVRYGGSSHLNALAGANALICIAAGVETLETGAQVTVRLL